MVARPTGRDLDEDRRPGLPRPRANARPRSCPCPCRGPVHRLLGAAVVRPGRPGPQCAPGRRVLGEVGEPRGEPGDRARVRHLGEQIPGRVPQRPEPPRRQRRPERAHGIAVEPLGAALRAVRELRAAPLHQLPQPFLVRAPVLRCRYQLAEAWPVAGHDVRGQHPAVADPGVPGGGRDHAHHPAGVREGHGGAAEAGHQRLPVRRPRLQLDPLVRDQLVGGGTVFGEGSLLEPLGEPVRQKPARRVPVRVRGCRERRGLDGRHGTVEFEYGDVAGVGVVPVPAAVRDDLRGNRPRAPARRRRPPRPCRCGRPHARRSAHAAR